MEQLFDPCIEPHFCGKILKKMLTFNKNLQKIVFLLDLNSIIESVRNN